MSIERLGYAMSKKDESREPEIYIYESGKGRFVLADGSDPLAAVAAMTGVDRSELDYLKDETPEQNRARLEELRKEATRRALPPYEFEPGVCPVCRSHDVREIVFGLVDELEDHQVLRWLLRNRRGPRLRLRDLPGAVGRRNCSPHFTIGGGPSAPSLGARWSPRPEREPVISDLTDEEITGQSFGYLVGDAYTARGPGKHGGHTITVTGFKSFSAPGQVDNVCVRCECGDEWEFMDHQGWSQS